MHRRLQTLLGLCVTLALALPARAAADVNLGTTAQPSGSSPTPCSSGVMAGQVSSDSSTSETVPSPGGQITQWQTNTTGDTAGAPLMLVVLRPNQGALTVVAIDGEELPTPLPAGGVATFTPPTPLRVEAGDLLGLYALHGVGNCAWTNVSANDRVAVFQTATAPAVGDSDSPLGTLPGVLVNVAATLAPNALDAAVTTATGPASATPGQPVLLSSTVSNNGPASGPAITFTDLVPSGLTVDSAVAGDGTCSTSGQTVTCAIDDLPAGQSVPVDVIVTPGAPGSYANNVSVAPGGGASDPNPANDSASAALSVVSAMSSVAAGPPPTRCVVPSLKSASPSLAKTVLKDLGCKVRATHAHSKRVRKGSVVRTQPAPGTYTNQAVITVVVSSGPKKHK